VWTTLSHRYKCPMFPARDNTFLLLLPTFLYVFYRLLSSRIFFLFSSSHLSYQPHLSLLFPSEFNQIELPGALNFDFAPSHRVIYTPYYENMFINVKCFRQYNYFRLIIIIFLFTVNSNGDNYCTHRLQKAIKKYVH
jgi:hypothetical protein